MKKGTGRKGEEKRAGEIKTTPGEQEGIEGVLVRRKSTGKNQIGTSSKPWVLKIFTD